MGIHKKLYKRLICPRNSKLELFANTPSRISLELTEQFERIDETADYWKNSFGEVTITFHAMLKYGAKIPIGRHIVGNMPVGYRPISYVATTLGYSTGNNAHNAADFLSARCCLRQLRRTSIM